MIIAYRLFCDEVVCLKMLQEAYLERLPAINLQQVDFSPKKYTVFLIQISSSVQIRNA